MSVNSINRRRFERFPVAAMYTPIVARRLDCSGMVYEGHAYDLSEGGVQFELDESLPTGTPLLLEVVLPMGSGPDLLEEDRTIRVVGNVVWNDVSEPGPARMAAAFAKFANIADRDRLHDRLGERGLTRAA